MKFMVTWKIPPAYMAAAMARFLKTGGAHPVVKESRGGGRPEASLQGKITRRES